MRIRLDQTCWDSSRTSAIQTRSRSGSKSSKAELCRSSWSPSTMTSDRTAPFMAMTVGQAWLRRGVRAPSGARPRKRLFVVPRRYTAVATPWINEARGRLPQALHDAAPIRPFLVRGGAVVLHLGEGLAPLLVGLAHRARDRVACRVD